MNLRRHENEEALHTTSTEITNLDFLDSPYRSVAPSIIEIADRIEDNTPSDALVIASAGIGRYRKGHADHILIRKVAQTLIERGRHVVFYADLPYMFPKIFFKNWPSRMFKRKIERELGMKIDIEPFELSPEQQMRKQTACQAYKTQFQAFHAFKKPGAYRWEVIIYPK